MKRAKTLTFFSLGGAQIARADFKRFLLFSLCAKNLHTLWRFPKFIWEKKYGGTAHCSSNLMSPWQSLLDGQI